MWGFLFGLLLGFAAKAVYDLVREEQLPTNLPINTGRLEALLDETRQTVRDLREEVRQAVGSRAQAVQERAGQLIGAGAQGQGSAGAAAGEPGGRSAERLAVTEGTRSAGSQDQGSAPSTTYSTPETLS